MNGPDGGKQAVVLSGGGADGAYEVGVMKALFSGQSPATNFRPLDPDIFAATSVGSYNAAFLVAQWETYGPAAITNLEQVWLDKVSSSPQKCDNGVFRFRANPLEFLNPVCFISNPLQLFSRLAADCSSLTWTGLQRAINFATMQGRPLLDRVVELFDISSFISLEPLQQTLHETIRFADIRRSKKVLKITTSNWATGILRLFANDDMTDQLGPLVIMASSAIPGFFPPVAIGGEPYVDGGVLMNTPMKPAIDAGADSLHVIYLDPDVKDIPLAEMYSLLDAVYRTQTIAWAKALDNDISIADHVNYEVAFSKLIANSMEILKQRTSDEDLLIDGIPLRDIERRLKKSAEHRPLTIHVYHPHADLGGTLGLLNFDRNRIRYLIEQGFNDAADFESTSYEIIRPLSPLDLSAQLQSS